MTRTKTTVNSLVELLVRLPQFS